MRPSLCRATTFSCQQFRCQHLELGFCVEEGRTVLPSPLLDPPSGLRVPCGPWCPPSSPAPVDRQLRWGTFSGATGASSSLSPNRALFFCVQTGLQSNSEQPVAVEKQPAASGQQPATSNQQPANEQREGLPWCMHAQNHGTAGGVHYFSQQQGHVCFDSEGLFWAGEKKERRFL